MMQQYLHQKQLELGKTKQSETKNRPSSPQSQQRPSSSNSTIAYKLFAYREELRNPQGRSSLKLSKTKLNLTQELVSYSVDHIMDYGMDELMIINRQITFTRKLKDHMNTMRQMQKVRASRSLSPQKIKIRSSG